MLVFEMALVIKHYVHFAFLFVHTVYQPDSDQNVDVLKF